MKWIAVLLFFVSSVYSADGSYFIVFLHKKDDKPLLSKDEVDKIMQGHMANIERLAKEGKLKIAGPFEGGGGIFIFEAEHPEEVNEWINSDPGVKAQRWNVEIRPYRIVQGKICKAPEPYEMVSYDFVRFNIRPGYSEHDEPNQALQHEQFLNEKISSTNLIASAMFDHGGILIVKGELKKELIDEDPAIKAGLYFPEYKKWYVAKGSFCEN